MPIGSSGLFPGLGAAIGGFYTPKIKKSYYGGGGSSYNYPSSGGYSYSSPKVSKPPKPKKPKPSPSLAQYLGTDADYQDQLRAFERALKEFGAENLRRKGTAETQYKSATKQLGEQRVRDLSDIEADFAARGILKSGLYGARLGEYEKTYQKSLGDIGTSRKSILDQIAAEEKRYKSEQSTQKESARKEAARRRAEKYGL